MQLHLTPPTLLYLISTFDSCRKTSTNRTQSLTPFSTLVDTTPTSSLYKNHGLIELELTYRQVSIKSEYQITLNSAISYRTSHQNTNQTSQHISPNTILAGPFNPDRTLSPILPSYYWKSHSNPTHYMLSTYTTQATLAL